MWVINDEMRALAPQGIVGKSSKKILARGRVPPFLAMPGFWMHIDPKPTPNWEKQGQWPFHYIERSCNGSDNGFMSPEKCFSGNGLNKFVIGKEEKQGVYCRPSPDQDCHHLRFC